MAQAIYKVRDPQGNIREISGPEGASDAEIISQAQRLFATPQASQPIAPNPQSERPGLMDTLGNAAIQGVRTMGPMGAVMGLVNPGIEEANKVLQSGAYKTGEKVTDVTGSPELGYAANIAVQATPTIIGGVIGSQAGKIGQSAGKKLMRMALKPSTTLGPEKTEKAVQTMLTEDVGNLMPGANVTQKGIDQLQNKREQLAAAVERLTNSSNKKINKYVVARALKDTEAKFGNQVNPNADIDAIQKVKAEFLQTRAADMPVSEAHSLKQGTYRVLGDKAYKGELKSADMEAQKALARGLRQQTEAAVPEIAPLNAQQSDLINAIKAAISRNATSGNKDPIGLGFLAGNPLAAAGFMANRSEYIKSLLARLLYNTSRPVGTAAGASSGGAAQYLNDQQQRRK